MSWTKCPLCSWMLEGGIGSPCTNEHCESHQMEEEAALYHSSVPNPSSHLPPLPPGRHRGPAGRIKQVTGEQAAAIKRQEAELRAKRKFRNKSKRKAAQHARKGNR